MFKQNTRRRILSFAFAVMMLITSAVPAFAMGYDDLQTVIDMTGTAASESAGEGDFSPEDIQQEPDSPIGPLEDMGESEDSKTPSPEDETVQEQSPEQNPPGQDVSEEPAREEISSTDETQPDEPEGAEKAGDTDASADEATIGAFLGFFPRLIQPSPHSFRSILAALFRFQSGICPRGSLRVLVRRGFVFFDIIRHSGSSLHVWFRNLVNCPRGFLCCSNRRRPLCGKL